MIYYDDKIITVRDMELSDGRIFTDEENKQGWNTTVDKFEMRINDRKEGKCISLVADYSNNPAGYVNIYIDSKWGSFANKGYPEIVDFAVRQKYQKRGIGSVLMAVAEKISSEYADVVYLGVGLHNGYGSAQRMYVKRGYIPDGTGVWYKDKVCTPYDTIYTNDDDLGLYLSKELR